MTVACGSFFFSALLWLDAELYVKFSILFSHSQCEYAFCVEIRFDNFLFNFFTSRTTSPKKQYEQYLFLFELSEHCAYTEHTQRASEREKEKERTERDYIYLYLFFRCSQHRYNTIFLTLESVFVLCCVYCFA